jgi:hypothetical protein
LAPAAAISAQVTLDGRALACAGPARPAADAAPKLPPIPAPPAGEPAEAPLSALAWARSGDKGNAADIDVIARDPALMPWIHPAPPPPCLRAAFPEIAGAIEILDLARLPALNILAHGTLRGGGAVSLRHGAQAKSWAQRPLAQPIAVPAALISPR